MTLHTVTPRSALLPSDMATAVVVRAVRLFAPANDFLFFQIRKIDGLKIINSFDELDQIVCERSVAGLSIGTAERSA